MPAVSIEQVLTVARNIATPLMDATGVTWSEENVRLGQSYWVPPGEARLRLGASYFSRERTLQSNNVYMNAEIRIEVAYHGSTIAARRAWVDQHLQTVIAGANPDDFAGGLVDPSVWTDQNIIHSLSAIPEAGFPEQRGNVVVAETVIAAVIYDDNS